MVDVFHVLLFIECVLPGAGSFEMVAYAELMKHADTVKGKAKLGLFSIHRKLFILCPYYDF